MDMKWQCWKAKVAGDLLAAAPHLEVAPRQEYIASRVEALVESYADGNMSELARFLGISTQGLWVYVHQEKVPRFDTLLKMCDALSTTPLAFLTAPLQPPLKESRLSKQRIPIISRGNRRGRPVTEEEIRQMRQTLEMIVALDPHVDPFTSLKEIAQHMGFTDPVVRKHCPDLSQAIVLRYKRHWDEEEKQTRMK
jgi:DNA-binding phage protein